MWRSLELGYIEKRCLTVIFNVAIKQRNGCYVKNAGPNARSGIDAFALYVFEHRVGLFQKSVFYRLPT